MALSGYKEFSGSNTYVGLAYVGHSHSIQIQYMCIENGNTALGGSHGEIFFHTTYGSSQQGISQQAYTNAMNGGRITSVYLFSIKILVLVVMVVIMFFELKFHIVALIIISHSIIP